MDVLFLLAVGSALGHHLLLGLLLLLPVELLLALRCADVRLVVTHHSKNN
jgi:hypothetical protein